MTGVLIQRGDVGTDMHTGKTPGEYEGHVKMYPGNVSTSPGKPHFVSKPPEARGEAWNRFSLVTLRSNQLCLYLYLRPLASTTVRQ